MWQDNSRTSFINLKSTHVRSFMDVSSSSSSFFFFFYEFTLRYTFFSYSGPPPPHTHTHTHTPTFSNILYLKSGIRNTTELNVGANGIRCMHAIK